MLEEIADRLGSIVELDNLGIDLHDPATRMLKPILAKGAHESENLGRPLHDDQGVCGWVFQHGTGQLVLDELTDPRVARFEDEGPVPGSLIVVPLRGRGRIAGVMTLERPGANRAFTQGTSSSWSRCSRRRLRSRCRTPRPTTRSPCAPRPTR